MRKFIDIISESDSIEPKVMTKEEKAEVRKLQTRAKDAWMWGGEALGDAAEAIAAGDEEKFALDMQKAAAYARKSGELKRQLRDIMGLDY